MKFEKCVNTDRERLEQYSDKLRTVDPDLPKDQVIFEEGVLIRDDKGYRMVVQVVTPNDPESEPCWSQAVLFSRGGRELAFTEPQESLVGEWVILYDMHEYHLILIPEGEKPNFVQPMPTDAQLVGYNMGDYITWKVADDNTILMEIEEGVYLKASLTRITKEEWEGQQD